jgi:hypothetical protein
VCAQDTVRIPCHRDFHRSRSRKHHVQPPRSKTQPKGAVGLTADQLRDLLQKLQASKFCRDHDLGGSDHVINRHWFLQSELLGLRWIDDDDAARTLDVAGKVVRASGEGRQRVEETKSAADRRKVPSPQFAVEMLRIRRGLSYLGERAVIHQRRSGRKV